MNTNGTTHYARGFLSYTVRQKLEVKVMNVANTPSRSVEDSSAKKRELTSPFSPEDKLLKKNRPQSSSSVESFGDKMDSEETGTMAHTQILTLPESELEKICDIIQPSIQGNVLTAIRGDITNLIKVAVAEVIDEKLAHLHSENKRLSRENSELKSRVLKLEQSLDDAEQYSRRNCLRISKFRENPTEDTDGIVLKIAETLGVRMSPGDIDRSHRIGKPGAKQHRDIIVKFATYRARERLFANRSKLKESELNGVYLNEDLTKKRSKLLYEARTLVKADTPSLLGAWSSNGTILVKDLREGIHRVSNETELATVKVITAIPVEDAEGRSQTSD